MASKGGEKPSDRRAGKRRDRNQGVGTRIPELGYYLIVTDTEETEKNYFEGLRDSIPAELKDHLVIKVEKAKTVELVKRQWNSSMRSLSTVFLGLSLTGIR